MANLYAWTQTVSGCVEESMCPITFPRYRPPVAPALDARFRGNKARPGWTARLTLCPGGNDNAASLLPRCRRASRKAIAPSRRSAEGSLLPRDGADGCVPATLTSRVGGGGRQGPSCATALRCAPPAMEAAAAEFLQRSARWVKPCVASQQHGRGPRIPLRRLESKGSGTTAHGRACVHEPCRPGPSAWPRGKIWSENDAVESSGSGWKLGPCRHPAPAPSWPGSAGPGSPLSSPLVVASAARLETPGSSVGPVTSRFPRQSACPEHRRSKAKGPWSITSRTRARAARQALSGLPRSLGVRGPAPRRSSMRTRRRWME